jgi:mRNA interferase RelE/StbE
MLALAAEPYPRGCRKLSHGDGWRIRVGDYRIIYTVDEANKVVTVFALGHRRDIYRR